jgi:hypothetical protein
LTVVATTATGATVRLLLHAPLKRQSKGAFAAQKSRANQLHMLSVGKDSRNLNFCKTSKDYSNTG